MDDPFVTPLVRRLAAQHGVPLASVKGSGQGGRIRTQDVLAAAGKTAGRPPAQPMTAAAVRSSASYQSAWGKPSDPGFEAVRASAAYRNWPAPD